MIPEAEIRRLAAVARVDPMVLDLDYSLGWFLAGLASVPDVSNRLIFKGGTCLRKCYFDGYRFSEDTGFHSSNFHPARSITGLGGASGQLVGRTEWPKLCY